MLMAFEWFVFIIGLLVHSVAKETLIIRMYNGIVIIHNLLEKSWRKMLIVILLKNRI